MRASQSLPAVQWNENSPLVELRLRIPDVDIKTRGSGGNTPLSTAVGQGDTVVVSSIFQRRPSEVDGTDPDFNTSEPATLNDRRINLQPCTDPTSRRI